MQRYQDCPLILRDFLSYHETIKGQSQQTIAEYYLDLRMFLRFMKLVKNELPIDTDLSSISIKDIDIRFIQNITLSDIYDFLSYLAHDREITKSEVGVSTATRSRKLSAIRIYILACIKSTGFGRLCIRRVPTRCKLLNNIS